jgi:hypothetical protein
MAKERTKNARESRDRSVLVPYKLMHIVVALLFDLPYSLCQKKFEMESESRGIRYQTASNIKR